MLGFICGLIVGAAVGALILGLVCAGKDFYDNDGNGF